MSFRFNFTPSSSESECPQEQQSLRKRKQPSPVGWAEKRFYPSDTSSTEEEEAPVVRDAKNLGEKDLPIPNPHKESIWMPNGKRTDIWVGLRKMQMAKPIRISRDEKMVNEAMVTITKAITIMTKMVRDLYINWNEWAQVSKIVSDLLPDTGYKGDTIRTTTAWRSFKANIYRSNRRTTWVRLSNALHLMGNEFPETKVAVNAAIAQIYSWLMAKGLTFNKIPEWRGSMNTKPEKIERNGFTYSFATRKN